MPPTHTITDHRIFRVGGEDVKSIVSHDSRASHEFITRQRILSGRHRSADGYAHWSFWHIKNLLFSIFLLLNRPLYQHNGRFGNFRQSNFC